MNIVHFVVYLMPVMLVFLIGTLIIFIARRSRKIIIPNILAISVVSIILIVYYLPSNNIFSKYNFPYINVAIGSASGMDITDREKIDTLLEVINKHTFTRSAVKTVETVRFPGNELTVLIMADPRKGEIIHLYVLDEQTEKNVLQINELMYNVKDKEALSRDISEALKEIGVK